MGHRASTWTWGIERRTMWSTIGRPNAAVFPVPVRACTTASLPRVAGSHTAICTGVGWV